MPSTTSSPDPLRTAARARLPLRLAHAALGALLCAAATFAHDFWIEPASFHPAAGELVRLELLVGEHLVGEKVARRDERVVRFVERGPSGTSAVLGRDGATPAGMVRPTDPGLHTILYEGTPSHIEIEAAKFEAYLREEGLEHVSAARAAAGSSLAPGRERYSRHAKSFLRVADGPASDAGVPLGAVLELVPKGDPFADAEVGFRLLYRGEPLAAALVVALSPDDPSRGVRARTDVEGRVRLQLPARGPVLVKAVHMASVTDGDPLADWQSFWSSLTLERGAPVVAGTDG